MIAGNVPKSFFLEVAVFGRGEFATPQRLGKSRGVRTLISISQV